MRQLYCFVVIFVFLYFLARVFLTGTLEVGKGDWGIDMGYTQLLIGSALIALSLLLLFYFRQHIFRIRETDKIMLILVTPAISLSLILLLSFHFIAHDPLIDLYHAKDIFGNGSFDKLNHFLAAFFLTIIALKISPRISTLMIMWSFYTLYELFEIVFIYSFATMPYDIWLFPEIEDVIGDVLTNTIGLLLGWFAMRKNIKR